MSGRSDSPVSFPFRNVTTFEVWSHAAPPVRLPNSSADFVKKLEISETAAVPKRRMDGSIILGTSEWQQSISNAAKLPV
jgi:hypothetical protein